MLFDTLDEAFDFVRKIDNSMRGFITSYKLERWDWENKWAVLFKGDSSLRERD